MLRGAECGFLQVRAGEVDPDAGRFGFNLVPEPTGSAKPPQVTLRIKAGSQLLRLAGSPPTTISDGGENAGQYYNSEEEP